MKHDGREEVNERQERWRNNAEEGDKRDVEVGCTNDYETGRDEAVIEAKIIFVPPILCR